MSNYFILIFFLLFITISILGYGFLLSNSLNKNLLKYNLGYIGLLGLLTLVSISYFTIFFIKHDFLHNFIIHFLGVIFFIYFFHKNKKKKDFFLLITLIILFSSAIFILKNHDDFSYYHFSYSLGLSQNKIQMGLGNLHHGYKHHSSLFFLNSLIYLPFIKYYLFHSIGFITLIFINIICLKFLLNKKERKNFSYIYIFYLFIIVYVNSKFYRIGEYGTDIAAQLIVLILMALMFITIRKNLNKSILQSNIHLIILIITYLVTVKAYFVLYLLFLIIISFIFYKNKDFVKLFFLNKIAIFVFVTATLFSIVNLSYTGCLIYPVKETCFSEKIPWALSQNEVEKMKIWYEGWAKAAAGPSIEGSKNIPEYIEKFNWLSGWFNNYFLYKGLENLGSILLLSLLFIIIFYRNKQKKYKKFDSDIFKILLVIIFLFCEWFYKHPTLRYGGYSLVAALIFLPTSLFLSKVYIKDNFKKISVITLIVVSILVFNTRNLIRINKEIKIYNSQSFPLFYLPDNKFKSINLNNGIMVFFPVEGSCWSKTYQFTPCTGGVTTLKAKRELGFDIFLKKLD